ncbi:MAG: hypothetical protein IKR72_01990 [Bacteroidales bacterium]|nr:hypothetical protein [Bacteroidales bacterium]
MSWNAETHRMTEGVHIHDVKAALGYNSLHLGTIIKNGTINKWARYKPFRSASPTLVTDAVRGASGIAWGMSFPQLNSPTQAVLGNKLYTYYDNDTASAAVDRMNGWAYLRPRGVYSGVTEWFRARDLVGYWADAQVPFLIQGGSIQASTQLSTATTLAALRRQTYDPAELDFADFDAIDSYYFGVVGYMVESGSIPSSPKYFVVSNSSPISAGVFSADVYFSGTNFPSGRLGTWRIYPCLISRGGMAFYQRSGQSLQSAQYLTLPCAKYWTASVMSNQRYATLEAFKYVNDKTVVHYRLVIHNESSAFTFNDVEVWFMHSGHTPADPRQGDEKVVLQGNISVAAGDTWDSGWLETTIQESLWSDLVLFATTYAGFNQVGPIAARMSDGNGKTLPDPVIFEPPIFV